MKKLLLGISSGVFYTLLSIGISLLTAPYFLKVLTREEFGIFYLANNLIIWTGLLNVGLRGSFKLQLATAVGKGEETDQLATTSFITQCFIAIAVFIISLSLSFFLPSIFQTSAMHSTDVSYVFIILSFSFAISLISNNLAAILSVYNKDLNVYTVRSILVSLQAVLSIVFLYIEWGIIGLSISALLTELFFFFYMLFLVRSKFSYASLDFSLFDRTILLNSLSIGKWFLAGFLAQLFIRHTDLFLIGKLTGMDQVASFIISSKLFLLASTFLLMIIKIATPQLIRLMQSGSSTDFTSEMTMLFLKFFIGITIISGTTIYIFNELFISWWVGSSYYLGNTINLMMVLAFFFASFNLAARTLLVAKIQLRSQKISALAEGVLHLTVSIIFGIGYGLPGIAAGIALSSALACCFSFIPLFLHQTDFDKTKRELGIVLFYVAISVLLLLAVFKSPSYGKNLLALAIIMVGFIFLFWKDVRLLTEKILRAH